MEERVGERKKKLEIVGESCAKKEEAIRRMEEELKVAWVVEGWKIGGWLKNDSEWLIG